jgi:hypothetical protein
MLADIGTKVDACRTGRLRKLRGDAFTVNNVKTFLSPEIQGFQIKPHLVFPVYKKTELLE